MTKVLVVDDERKMRRVLQIELERMGIDSVAAESGEEALARFQSEKIDLVLTDLKMPGMSGLELLARVRELDADVPVIVLTAYGTVQTAVEAMKLGAFDYVLKPFDLRIATCGSGWSRRRRSTAWSGAPRRCRLSTTSSASSVPPAAPCW